MASVCNENLIEIQLSKSDDAPAGFNRESKRLAVTFKVKKRQEQHFLPQLNLKSIHANRTLTVVVSVFDFGFNKEQFSVFLFKLSRYQGRHAGKSRFNAMAQGS